MFYRGMPDTYQYDTYRELWQVFWYDGEFHLQHKDKTQGGYYPLPSEYFDDVNELLNRMLEIAPFKDWRRVDAPSS